MFFLDKPKSENIFMTSGILLYFPVDFQAIHRFFRRSPPASRSPAAWLHNNARVKLAGVIGVCLWTKSHNTILYVKSNKLIPILFERILWTENTLVTSKGVQNTLLKTEHVPRAMDRTGSVQLTLDFFWDGRYNTVVYLSQTHELIKVQAIGRGSPIEIPNGLHVFHRNSFLLPSGKRLHN